MVQPKALKAYWAMKNHNRHVIAKKEYDSPVHSWLDDGTVTPEQQRKVLASMLEQRKEMKKRNKQYKNK